MSYSRTEVVNKAEGWVGLNEADGSYKKIIDIYNSDYKNTPRKLKMLYEWPWCACFWSAVAIDLGYQEIMPREMSCEYLISLAKTAGIWVEDDGYVPQPGDACLYDWQDTGVGDNTGVADHIGVVTYSNKSSGYFVVTEGNYSNAVKKRTISINGRYIRGFITPKYDTKTAVGTTMISGKTVSEVAHEVIAGLWGNGDARVTNLTKFGYDAKEIQKMVNDILNGDAASSTVNKVEPNRPVDNRVTATTSAQKFAKSVAGTYQTTANLYLRNDSGTNKKALCLIPKGAKVNCYGYYNVVYSGNYQTKWLYVQVQMDGVLYTGFACSTYLKKV